MSMLRTEPRAAWRVWRGLGLGALSAMLFCWGGGTGSAQVAGLGGLRGLVTDADVGSPLRNARIAIDEAGLAASTDEQGRFVFDAVQPGIYTIVASKAGYETAFRRDVAVAAGTFKEVRIVLTSEVIEMEEVSVAPMSEEGTEEALLAERQDSSSLLDSLGKEFFSKAGASTAAAALKKVVGTSVVDDKYVVVRGMGDRYVGTVLNGARIPSADPDRRAVNVDIFPTKLVDSIAVSKSFTPDQPGEFSGGGVDIRTLKFPSRFTFDLSGSVEHNPGSTASDNFLRNPGEGTGYLGQNAKGRGVPDDAALAPLSDQVLTTAPNVPTAQRWDKATRSFEPYMGTIEGKSGVNHDYSGVLGDTYSFLGADLGLIVGASYSHKYKEIQDGRQERWEYGGPLSLSPDDEFGFERLFDVVQGKEEVLWGTLFGLGLKPSPDQEVGLTVLFNHSAVDTAIYRESDPRVGDGQFLVQDALYYLERTLLAVQLSGRHALNSGAELTWTGSYGRSLQDEPDIRSFKEFYDPADNRYRPISADARSGASKQTRTWRSFEDNSYNMRADMKIPLAGLFGGDDEKSHLKAGVAFDRTDREFTQDAFGYFQGRFGRGSYVPEGEENFADVFLAATNIGQVAPNSRNLRWNIFRRPISALYSAEQTILAGYVMGEVAVADPVVVGAGARIENTDLIADAGFRDPVDPFFPVGGLAQIQQADILPAIWLTATLAKDLTLRAAMSQTVARPSFKEIAPIIYEEPLTEETFLGNAQLRLSRVENYDLRLEWLPKPGSLFGAGVFYKRIEDPIEVAQISIAETTYTQFQNFPEGRVYGIEMEMRHRFGDSRLAFQSWDFLSNFELGLNASYLVSVVENPPEEVQDVQALFGVYNPTRPLQGQPAYTVNANVAYDNDESGTLAALFFGMTGPFLYRVGQDANPDVYELPAPALDFTFAQRFFDHWKFTLRIKNILDPEFRREYEAPGQNRTYESYRRGRAYSLGLSYSW